MAAVPGWVSDIVDRYVGSLRDLGVNPVRIVLFGSHASGEATALSDIDLLVVSTDFSTLSAPERVRVLARANLRLLEPIQALWATPESLRDLRPTDFLHHVLATGVELPIAPDPALSA